jgi:hypothetical protein
MTKLASSLLVSLTIALGAGVPALAAPPTHRAPVTSPAATSETRTARADAADRDADAARYAKAEKKSPEAAKYEGGAAVVIIGSTTAVILGVILLLVLL